jgi:type I restriction enzyme R subunit
LLGPGDKLVYVNNAILGKLLENGRPISQSGNNTKEQFSSSPDLDRHLEDATMDSMAAFAEMGKQALIPKNQKVMKELLLGPVRLYETLREKHSLINSDKS